MSCFFKLKSTFNSGFNSQKKNYIPGKIAYRKLFLGIIILGALFFLSPGSVNASTWTWTGNISTDWNNAGNWNPQSVPNEGATVIIRAGTIYPVISGDITVATITISDWSKGGKLTVSNGATFTVTKALKLNNNGSLFLDNGTLQFNGSTIEIGFNHTSIQITDGGRLNSPNAKLTMNGELVLDSGSINLGNGFKLSTNKVFTVTEGNINIYGTTLIEGTVNGGIGKFVFDGDSDNNQHAVYVGSTGRFYMSPYSSDELTVECEDGASEPSEGSIDFYISCFIGSNGQFLGGNAYVTFYKSVSPGHNSTIETHNGNLVFKEDLTARQTADINITCNGIIRVEGNTILGSNAHLNAEQGIIYFEGNIKTENSSGVINAGSSTIFFSGDSFENEGYFNAGTSTFVFNGSGSQLLSTYYWRTNNTFYNLIVENNSIVRSSHHVMVLNDMTVNQGSEFNLDSGLTLDVVGVVTGDAYITTDHPYIIVININSSNSITAVFDEALESSSAQRASNYWIENESGRRIDYPTNPTLGGANNNQVTLTLGFDIAEETNYYLIVNNVVDLDYNGLNQNHKKRFILSVPVNFWQWTGLVSSDWDTPGNWSKNQLPSTDAIVAVPLTPHDPEIFSTGNQISELEISEDASLTISSTGNLTVDNTIQNNRGNSGLVIASTSEGTGSLISYEDNIPASFQRYISGEPESWQMISSPVANQGVSGDFTPTGGSDAYGDNTRYDFYAWYEPDTSWVYLLNDSQAPTWLTANGSNQFVPGKGYLISYKDAHPTKIFKGNLNNGSVSVSLTSTAGVGSEFSYNFVGNPYSSSIDWKSASGWNRNALENNGGGYDVWIWSETNQNYGAYNSASASDDGTLGVSRYIAPTQGFFVKAAQSGTLSMDNSVRVHDGADNWLKSAYSNANEVAINLESTDGYGNDEVVIEFGHSEEESGTPKRFSFVPTSPSLFIPDNEHFYSIRLLGEKEEFPVLPISFKAGASGNYKLTATFNSGNFEIFKLIDRITGETYDFKEGDTYSFYANSGERTDRFVLQIVPGNYPDPQEALPILIYSAQGKINVDLRLVEGEYTCSIFSISGRKLMTTILEGEQIARLTVPLATGIVIVQVEGKEGKKVGKVAIF